MALLKQHVQFYKEIFTLPGFLSEPFLMFGYQDIWGKDLPREFDYADVKLLLRDKGIRDITTMDFFDPRADLHYDMNVPIPLKEHEQYATFMDIGCLEHLFDTRQCLENSLRTVRVGGIYMLHTPVNGYYGHGLHVFNPEGLINFIQQSNFEIIYKKFSNEAGELLVDPSIRDNVVIWLVARKIKSMPDSSVCQQTRWVEYSKSAKRYGAEIFLKEKLYSMLKPKLASKVIKFFDLLGITKLGRSQNVWDIKASIKKYGHQILGVKTTETILKTVRKMKYFLFKKT